MNSLVLIVLLTTYIMPNVNGDGEVFTAMSDMEDILDAETFLISILEDYIVNLKQKILYFEYKLKQYKKEHNEATRDVLKYLSNPLNSYLLIKRLTMDWEKIENVMEFKVEPIIANVTEHKKIMKFPTNEDLTGAALGLYRLQDTYKLDTHELAQGKIKGVQYR